jgi:uncharacterized protein (TIGR03437 family)
MDRNKHAFMKFTQSRKALWGAVLAVLALGISDTARAQGVTLTLSTTQLTFNNIPKNSGSQPQFVMVTASQQTTIVTQVSQNSSWLAINPNGPLSISSPISVAVTVNTTGLTSGSTYQGSFTVSVSGQNQNTQTVNVTLTVGTTSSVVTANPATLSFSAAQGATTATPAGSTVQITSVGAQFNYTLSAATTGGGSWLLLDHTSGATGDAGFMVSTNPSGLAGGVYNGTVTAQSTTTTDSVQIPVTLTINSNATLTVSPANPPPFLYQLNGTVPSPQTLSITASTGSVAYSVQVPAAATWLIATPLQGVASASAATLNLSVSTSNLQPGTYNTNVTISPQNGSTVPAIPITLVVSANALLTLSTNTLNYTAQFAGQSPPDQTVAITAIGNGPAVGFVFSSDSTWLTANTPSNSTPATMTVHVSPGGLLVGNYVGKITIRPSNGDNYSQVLTVNLTVGNASQLTAAPPVLLFSYQIGQQLPSAQPIQIGTNATQVSFTATAATTNCGSTWLQPPQAQSSSAPTTIFVSVAPPTTANVCTGSVTISYGSNQTLVIPVTLNVTTTPQLAVSLPAGFGSYTLVPDATLASQRISLTSTDPNTPVSFTATSPSTFISLASTQGNTPQNLVVNISAVGLVQGVYQGQIVITSANLPNNSLIIPVTLTVTPNTVVTVNPPGTVAAPITFTQAQGGAVPAAQVLTMTSAGGTATYASNITTNAGGSWLAVSPTSGTASGPLTVSIASNQLSQGTYTGQIVLSLQNASTSSITINVTLNVTAPQFLIVNPSQTFTFTYQLGQPQPAPQRFKVTSGGATQLTFQVGTTTVSGGSWLSTDITSGTTPADVNLQVNAAGLAAGTYNGSATVTATGVSGTATLNVVLSVVAPAAPVPNTIKNSASLAAGFIAPGEIVSIFGTNLGPALPANGTTFTLNNQGGVDPTLAGVQVLFNGKAGTPIYVSANQINVIVPYEVAGQATTSMVVQYLGIPSAPFNLSVAVQAPGIYTINSAGLQAAALNQNGSVNGTGANGTAYASPDTTVVFFATGGGQTSPASVTGSVTPIGATLYKVPNVTATVGGQPAVVEFAGGAPGLVAGVLQVNVHIPKGLTGDALQVVISVNGVPSPVTGPVGQGPTVAVH